MKIIPHTTLINEYDEISEYCHKEGEPIFITNNGEGELVVISIEAYELWEKSLNLREENLNLTRKMFEDKENRPK